jgi:hypothetical protein
MSEPKLPSLQAIEDAIVFQSTEAVGSHIAGYMVMKGVLRVEGQRVYDPKYPVEGIAKKEVVRQIFDQLFEQRYSEIARALHEFSKFMFVVAPEHMEKVYELRSVILNGGAATPPVGYGPEQS